MFINLITWALLFLLPNSGNTSKPEFAVNTIPESLTKNANAVVRQHQTTFVVKSLNNATEKVHYAVTILNEKAGHHTTIEVPYDKFTKVISLKGTLYDKTGKEIKRLKSNEIQDVGGISSSLIDDVRIKAARFTNVQYPLTVEFEYEISYSGLLFYPVWQPQTEFELSVENAVFQIQLPNSWPLRYKNQNIGKPVISNLENYLVNTWKSENLPAIEPKPFSPPLSDLTPVVYTAPNDFEIEGFKGNMNTWEGFGKWINLLNLKKDALPEATVNKLKQLVANSPDDYAKTSLLYNYLQDNTRYVSIQLGIGGWQPFEAGFVDSKGYGDCKALSNYMKAMLKAVNINSYYALISAGTNKEDIRTDFPSNQFNHATLCVPLAKDTLWLECTSQTESFGYAGSFTGNRHALLITPQGGKIVKTPVYQQSDNSQNRVADIHLELNGSATANIKTTYRGLLQDTLSHVITSSVEDQKDWLHAHLTFPGYTIRKFEFTQQKNRIPAITEKLDVSVTNCASVSGKRIFFTPNLLNQLKISLPHEENRSVEIVNKNAYVNIDTIRFHLANGNFNLEFLPQAQNFKSFMGEFSATYQLKDNVITYIRSLKINRGKFPANRYAELQQFYRDISKADKLQVVLTSKT